MCEKKYSSGTSNSEHAFLIIQADNVVYRNELTLNRDTNQTEIKVKFRIIYDVETLLNVLKNIIWRDKFPSHAKDKLLARDQLCHKTWAINEEKFNILIKSCLYDKKNPPPYFMLGNDSLFKPRHIIMNTPDFFIRSFLNLTLSSFNQFNDPTNACVALCFILCTASLYLKSKIPKSFFDHPTNFHSCASWAGRKLLDLKDPQINKDMQGSWLASIAQLPSLYTGNLIEAMQPLLSLGGTTYISDNLSNKIKTIEY